MMKEGISMEFREISTFLQVAQHQSFSKAAKQLGYSQAAVTIQIKQLEGELGVHLFDRIGKQISLTHQGQIFYQYAVAIQKDLEQARSAVSDSSSLNGKLCLGTIESICASMLSGSAVRISPALPRGHHQHCYGFTGCSVKPDKRKCH